MDRDERALPSLRRRGLRTFAALGLALTAVLPVAAPVRAAGVTLEATPLLAGHIRPGSWVEVQVTIANDGPAVAGELRITSPQQGASSYGTRVELPTTSRQRFTLHARAGVFGTRLQAVLVSEGQQVASQALAVQTHDPMEPVAGIVAERPQGLVPDIDNASASGPDAPRGAVVTLTPEQLPTRAEAWAVLDRLVWQDIDAATRLSDEQRQAMDRWVAAGGQLVLVAGTTGSATFAGFPEHLLPFVPSTPTEVRPEELRQLIGTLPPASAPLPAISGTLRRGSALVRAGDQVAAAQARYGEGNVSLLGFDLSTKWLAGTPAVQGVWRRLMPTPNHFLKGGINDDSQVRQALNILPTVALPTVEQLFILLLAYIVLVGPINYLVLRRLDRREWAWVTMPVLVIAFAVASYVLGVGLKGSDVIVNQVAIVRAGEGTDRGLAQAYVGVFSPTRKAFDVLVPGGALLSNTSSQFQETEPQPLDVILGEPSSLRGFQVGYGVLRDFRADVSVTAPRVESALVFRDGRLKGTITNRSDTDLEAPAVLFGRGIVKLPSLAAGQTQQVDVDPNGPAFFETTISERLYGSPFSGDQSGLRAAWTRRAVVDQMFGYGPFGPGGPGASVVASPMLLAWRPAPVVPLELAGERITNVGETLFVTPLSIALEGNVAFSDALMRRTIVGSDAIPGFSEGPMLALGHGTMTVEYRPTEVTRSFSPTTLDLVMTRDEPASASGQPKPLDPLPEKQQPPQDDPAGDDDPGGDGGPPGGFDPGPNFGTLPAVQLFDRVSERWVEFPPLAVSTRYRINGAERYVDATGTVLARFVNRSDGQDPSYFSMSVAVEGTVE